MKVYPEHALWQEITYLAYHLHWSARLHGELHVDALTQALSNGARFLEIRGDGGLV